MIICASSKSSLIEGATLEAAEPAGIQFPGGGGVKSSSSGLVGGTSVPCLASWMWRAMALDIERPSFPRSHYLGVGALYECP